MANPINPKTLTIKYDGKDEDGNAVVGFKGFEVLVNGEAFLSLPATLNTSGVYTADIQDEVRALPNGVNYQLVARTHAVQNIAGKDTDVYSPDSVVVPFDVAMTRKPTRPFAVTLA